MSVILDALRKLDREKSSHKKRGADIATGILKPDAPRPGKRYPFYIISVCITAAIAVVITYFTMSKSVLPASPPALVAQPVSIPQEPVLLPLRETDVKEQANISAHTKSGKVINFESSKNSIRERNKEAKDIPATSESAPAYVPPPPSPPERTVNESTHAPKGEKMELSAIVWYEEPSRRFAMINGAIAREGNSIDGAEIVEIKPSSVRFLRNGQYFEVSMPN